MMVRIIRCREYDSKRRRDVIGQIKCFSSNKLIGCNIYTVESPMITSIHENRHHKSV